MDVSTYEPTQRARPVPLLAIFFWSLGTAAAEPGDSPPAWPDRVAVEDSVLAIVERAHDDVPGERIEIVPLGSLADLELTATDEVLALEPPVHPSGWGRLTFLVRVRTGERTVVRPVSVDVRMTLGGVDYAERADLTYTAKAARKGTAK